MSVGCGSPHGPILAVGRKFWSDPSNLYQLLTTAHLTVDNLGVSNPKVRSRQPRDKNTLTQSVSFEKGVYAFLEEQRVVEGMAHAGKPMPRSEYIALALVEKWTRDGQWPPKAKR